MCCGQRLAARAGQSKYFWLTFKQRTQSHLLGTIPGLQMHWKRTQHTWLYGAACILESSYRASSLWMSGVHEQMGRENPALSSLGSVAAEVSWVHRSIHAPA